MQQRQEQERLQQALAKEQADHAAKMDQGRRLFESIDAMDAAPPNAAAEMGIPQGQVDPYLRKLARARLEMGDVTGAIEMLGQARTKARDQDQLMSNEEMLAEIEFAKKNPGYKPSFKRRGGSATFEAPPAPDTEWRDGARYGTEELYNKKTGEPMGKTRLKGQKPPEPKDKPEMIDGLSPERLKIVESITDKFNSHPTVESALISGEGITYANSFDINSKSSADDISLIYAYAKVNDPPSVVRESEADLIRRNAQSLASTYGFNAQRLLAGTQLLTPEARANMIKAMNAKHAARDKQYQNTRSEFSKRIARYVGPEKADSFLPNYSAGMTMPGSAPAQGGAAAPKEGDVIVNPQTKERLRLSGGQWVPAQ
jgi:hypothetical protein